MKATSILALAGLLGSIGVTAQDITVVAPAGTIIGQPGRFNPAVQEFLGIPFALPPSGARRFEAPVRAPPAASPISAKKFGFSCPAVISGVNQGLPVNLTGPEGEDCLSLNIWTRPAFQNAPVMVWFYGGGFTFGSADSLLYDGTHFVTNNNVLVVTVNYRTNVFGFPNSPALEEQNLGLMDQRVAVEWVRDNISKFGGDPKKITIFGHSAGGASVDIYSFAYRENPIVRGFIEQSGAVALVPLLGGGDNFNAWNNLATKAGCGTGTDAEKLACMKTKPFTLLKDILTPDVPAPGECPSTETPGAGFGPRVDNKIIFSPAEYTRKAAAGEYSKFPVLTGSTDQEFPPEGLTTPPPPGCPAPPNPIPGLPPNLPPQIVADLVTAAVFGCPSRVTAAQRSKSNVPVWRYRYFGDFNFNSTYEINVGATHGAELPVLFGLADLIGTLPPREKAVLKEMQAAWAAFATDPVNGLAQAPFKWPKWNTNILSKNLVRLAYKTDTKASFDYNAKYDYWCLILNLLPASAAPGSGGARRSMIRRAEEAALPEGVTAKDVELVKSLTEEQIEALTLYAASLAGL